MIEIRSVSVFSGQGKMPAQEDAVAVDRERRIFVVADGFGGPTAGAAASKLACDEIQHFLVKESGDLEATLPFVIRSYFSLAGNVLFNALLYANRKAMAQNKEKGIHERGGASVLAGFMDGDLLALAAAGGCSAWLFREGKEASLVMERTYGKLCEPFFADLPIGLRAPLTALGMSEDLEPEIFEYRVQKGDWLLLATDGLGSELRGKILELQRSGEAEAARKVTECLEQGNREGHYQDNVAVSLIVF